MHHLYLFDALHCYSYGLSSVRLFVGNGCIVAKQCEIGPKL